MDDLGSATTAEPAQALERVRGEIAAACRKWGRDPAAVTLIAVSKTFGAEAIVPVIAAGQRVFGENRVQEARAKWPALQEAHPDIALHLIGPLQSNKAKDAVAMFDAIHALDRDGLAGALTKEIARQNRRPQLFVQVNTGAEPQKSGVLAQDADAFIARCREVHGLVVSGLMCIPPEDEPPASHFALLRELGKRNELPLLSMGMSADFLTAIEFGATHVRVGSAIFGARGSLTKGGRA